MFPGIPSFGTLSAEVETLKLCLSQIDSPVVLCHNDLLVKNIIYNQSQGKEEQQNEDPGEIPEETFNHPCKLVNLLLM